MPRAKPNEQRRRQERQERRETADDQFAREARGGAAGQCVKVFGLAHQPPRFDQELASGPGQRDAYRLVANEKIEAELLFESVQRLGHRRLRKAQAAGAGADAALVRNGDEAGDLAQRYARQRHHPSPNDRLRHTTMAGNAIVPPRSLRAPIGASAPEPSDRAISENPIALLENSGFSND